VTRVAVPAAVGLAVGLLMGGGWAVTRSPGAEPGPGPGPVEIGSTAASRPVAPGDVLLAAWAPAPIGFADVDQVRRSPAIEWAAPVRRDEVPVVAVTEGGAIRLAAQDGAHVPVDVVAVEPHIYAPLMPAGSMTRVAALGAGEALVGASTARRWRAGPGAVVRVAAGGELRVAAVVDDEEIGGAELAVTATTGLDLGVVAIRYLLVRSPDRERARAALGAVMGDRFRVRAPGETPFLRDADAVPPLALVKERFGEPAVRTLGPERFEIDPAWVAANIETAEVPVLGEVACHRAVLPALRAAMAELHRTGLAWLVDPAAAHACWAPRLIAPASGNRRLSRHAWGIAVDLNPHRNLPGTAPAQAPELVAAMQRHGFTWGGDWLRPEGAYFEFVGGPGV
jgi:hypothetical protein